MLKKPYKGDENYIFISYSHRNMKEVLEFIETLQNNGYNVWYDEGIDPGTEWDDNIAKHIEGCAFFIAFITKEYIDSQNCRDEMSFARDLDKERLLVYAEDVDLPRGMQMRLNRLQAIYKHKYANQRDFYNKVFDAQAIDACKNGINVEPTTIEADLPTEPKQEKRGNSKLVIIIVSIIVCIALVIGLLFFLNSGNNSENEESKTKADTTVDTLSDSTDSGVIEISKTNTRPTLYSDDEINISVEELTYVKGSSDLSIMLNVDNQSSELLFVALDDVVVVDGATVRPMFNYTFNEEDAFDAKSSFSSSYHVAQEDLENAGVSDFKELTCTFRFKSGERDLGEKTLHITRDAFTE